jgi:hypothetical protein
MALATTLAISSFASAQTLLSQGKTALASSQEGSFGPAAAIDGSTGTRWASNYKDAEWIYVDLGALATINRVVLNWEAAYGKAYQIQVSDNASSWTTIYSTTTGDGAIDDLTLSGTGRYVRMNGITRGTGYGYSLWEFQVYGDNKPTASLLSTNAPAVASSAEGGFIAASAVDNNTTTRWGSNFTDAEWIYMDLGSSANISRVVLNWEAAYGRGYQIQVSDNASSWTTIYTTTSGDGGIDDLAVSGSGRYVRMNGTARATGYGYSLWEFQVYGSRNGVMSSSSVATSAATSTSSSVKTSSSVATTSSAAATTSSVKTSNSVATSSSVKTSSSVATSSSIAATSTSSLVKTSSSIATSSSVKTSSSVATSVTTSSSVRTSSSVSSNAPDFGSNVVIFDNTMDTASIQSQINNIYSIQQNNQFGTPRTAIFFKPGTYNIDIPVGFFTHVMGLGAFPDQVKIASVRSEAALPNNNATQNFWRGVENFSVTQNSTMRWGVSQAVPFRRMHVTNGIRLSADYGWASGGWMADSLIDGAVDCWSQQQWISRNSQWGSFAGQLWNQVFVGIPNNVPTGQWPTEANTVVNTTPIIREKPFVYLNGSNYEVFVPSLRYNSAGISWANNQQAGTSIPLDQFYIAKSGVDSAATINAALAQGKHLLLTPGIYDLVDPINVTNANTIVLGIGFPTLHPITGKAALTVADVDGVKVAHMLVDAAATNSPVLVQIGQSGSNASHTSNPTSIADVFIRVGGAGVAKATVAMQVNSNDTIIDHTWIWRADHGEGAGWYSNTSQNGLVVNGNNVTAYGLFVEHFQQYQVLWNGNNGRTYFYQSEIPYDPPTQPEYTSGAGINGWASYKVADSVSNHEAWGLGVYAVFLQPDVYLSHAIEVPNTPNVKFHHMVTVNLTQYGAIQNVINNTGGSTAPGVAVNTPRVTDYPAQ